MARLGGWEWIIILVVVVLLFGPGRISKVVGEVGRSIKSFREGLSGGGEEDAEKKSEEEKKQP